MSFLDKRRKRLRWFLAAICAIGIVGTSAYVIRNHQLEVRACDDCAQGKKLLEEKDYFDAMQKIGPYVRRHPNDVESLFAYAQAREKVPEPDNKNLSETLAFLRRIRGLDPHHQGATAHLIDLYTELGLDSELRQLCTEVLKSNPDDAAALHGQAIACCRLRDFNQARTSALAYNGKAPQDVDGYILTFQILQQCDHGDEQLLAQAEKLRKAAPNDHRFAVLQSVAFSMTGDQKSAEQCVEAELNSPMPDPKTSLLLIHQCEALGIYDRALAILDRDASKMNDPALSEELASRLWQLGRYQQVIDRFAQTNATNSSKIQAIRCMALYRMHDPRAADSLASLKMLATNDGSALNWVNVISAVFASKNPDDRSIIEACEEAIKLQPRNPYFHFFLAEAYERIGESEAAMRNWHDAAVNAGAWADPMIRLSQAMLSGGQIDRATQFAHVAVQRAPEDSDAILVDASARVAAIDPGKIAQGAEVVKTLDSLKLSPSDQQRILPLRALALVRIGQKAGAIDRIRAALSDHPAPSAEILLQLAAISRQAQLGLEDQCLDTCQRIYGMNPELAFAKARTALEAGNRQQGLAIMQSARPTIRQSDDLQMQWDIAWARYLDLANDPRCKQSWIDLADQYPQNPRIQWMALSASSVQSDHDFIGKVLDRLQEQFGNQGLTWRLARARWLLDHLATEKDKIEAATMLGEITRSSPDMLTPHLLLADCLDRLGNISGAIDQLTTAANLQPDSSQIALQLSRMLESQNDFTRARVYLDKVLTNPESTPQQQYEAAGLVAAQGDSTRALQVLEALMHAPNHPIAPDLLLAKLYRETGQTQKLDVVCKQLLAAKPDAQTIAFVADYYESSSRPNDAAAALKQLDSIHTEPGEKEIIRGENVLRRGQLDQAIAFFKAATESSPGNAVAWRNLIRTQLGNGNCDDALASARVAQTQLKSDRGMQAFIHQAPAAFALVKQTPESIGLLANLLGAPENEPAVSSVFQTLTASDASQKNILVQKIRGLADSNSRILPLQLLASRLCLEANQPEDAATIAARATNGFPADASAAAMNAQALAACGRWSEALAASQVWRDRSIDNPSAADQMIAAAQFHLGNLDAAGNQLDPYLEKALIDPDRMGSLLLEEVQIKVQMGKTAEAANLLRPLLRSSQQARLDWMVLSATGLKNTDESVKWLNEVEATIPQNDLAGKVALAEAWGAFARRTPDPTDCAGERTILSKLIPQCLASGTAEQLVSLGSLSEGQKDSASAEACYKTALAKNPNFSIASNNLAMLYARNGKNLDQALALAKQATSGNDPNLASFYDTLAFVDGQCHNYSEAIEASQKAVHLQPDDPSFQIRLATIFIDNRQISLALPILDHINSMPNLNSSPPEVLHQLQSLRDRLNGTRTSSAQPS